ncbi:MAG TPA: transcription termination factor Rho, partial [Candidatus Marinimicrobia bacterium]|nr:transcription termination factor Rho [Candidatus Neomarinimicrobiota bacterium]
MDINKLQGLKIKQLTELAQKLEVPSYSGVKKKDLILKILKTRAEKEGNIFATGVLEAMPEGYGFLRSQAYHYLPGPDDIYVSPSQIKRFRLRTGHQIAGQIRPPKDNERFYALLKVETVNGQGPDKVKDNILFDNLTPLYPDKKINLEVSAKGFSMRILDLMAPIGKGQ